MLTTTTTGVGKNGWYPTFFAAHHFYKASHSSYVIIGAELGYPGLFLFCGVLYCCLRTLITARTDTSDEERLRRMLFVLVVSYMVSSWMVNFEYRPTFFMFAGAIAALHRLLHGLSHDPKDEREEEAIPVPAWQVALLPPPAPAGVPAIAQAQVTAHPGGSFFPPDSEEPPAPEPAPEGTIVSRIGKGWNRLGWMDYLITALMVYAIVRFWAYIMMRM